MQPIILFPKRCQIVSIVIDDLKGKTMILCKISCEFNANLGIYMCIEVTMANDTLF